MGFKQLVTSKVTLIILACLGGAIVLLGVFRLGMVVGYRQAGFACQWGENYREVFGHPLPPPMMGDFMQGRPMHEGGIIGSILQIGDGSLNIKDDDGTEKSVIVSTSTALRRGNDTLKLQDLKADDRVMIFGESDNKGRIQAKLIRLFVAPPKP